MLATGAGAIIGGKMGQKKDREASEIFTFITLVLLGLSLFFTVLGIVFLKPICILLGSSDRLLPHVLPYAFVIFLGSIPMSFKLFFEYMVRTDGKPGVGMAMSMAGLVCNVIFDYIFVAVLDMGTFGAAWGTFLSITVSMLIGLVYFLKFSHIRFCRPRASGRVLFKSCTNGSSEMLTEMSTGITTFLFNVIVLKHFGEDGVAAVTIIMYIYYFFIAFYMGIAVATAPIVSYNVGSGDHVFDLTWEALKLFSPVFLFIGWNVFLSGYFTALGNGPVSALISSLRSLILVVAFILILPRIIGVTAGIWLTMPLSEIVTVFVALYLYRTYGKQYMLEG